MCSERDSPLEPFVLPAPGQPELARLICGAHLGPPVLTRKQKRPRVNSLVSDREAAFCAAGPPEVLLVCDLNRTPNCYGKTWRLLCPFFRNLHLRENLARDCFTSTSSTVTNSVQNISLPVYVIVTNTRLQPLTTTFYNSMLVSFSLLKIQRRLIKQRSFLCALHG